jgi:hypothetical protein
MSYERRFVALQESCVPTHLSKIYRFVSLDKGIPETRILLKARCWFVNGIRRKQTVLNIDKILRCF